MYVWVFNYAPTLGVQKKKRKEKNEYIILYSAIMATLTSSSGVPKVPFDEDPARLVIPDKSVEESILYYRELTQKCRFLEANIEERLTRTESKLAELDKNLQVVRLLQAIDVSDGPIDLDFELGDTLYARGTVSSPQECKVHLWLSSGAMVVYSPSQAESMLSERYTETKQVLKKIEEEQRCLKEQITTAEVNTARLYNYHLATRKS